MVSNDVIHRPYIATFGLRRNHTASSPYTNDDLSVRAADADEFVSDLIRKDPLPTHDFSSDLRATLLESLTVAQPSTLDIFQQHNYY